MSVLNILLECASFLFFNSCIITYFFTASMIVSSAFADFTQICGQDESFCVLFAAINLYLGTVMPTKLGKILYFCLSFLCIVCYFFIGIGVFDRVIENLFKSVISTDL